MKDVDGEYLIQSIKAKFKKLKLFLDDVNSQCLISVICI